MMYLSETEAIFLPLSLVKISLSWKTHSPKLYYDNTVELVQSDTWFSNSMTSDKNLWSQKFFCSLKQNLSIPTSCTICHISLVRLDMLHCILLVTLFCTKKICSNARHCWKISEKKNTFWLSQDNSFVSIRGIFSSIVIEVIFWSAEEE